MAVLYRALGSVLILWIGSESIRGQTIEDRKPVAIQMDCREGVGLIPSLWRGIRGQVPAGLKVRVVCLGVEPVRAAWEPKLRGGRYVWWTLDAALDSLNRPGVDLILPLPVPAGEGAAKRWPELVAATVRRAAGRVARFEIRPGEGDLANGGERYLQFYESGVWAAYGANREAKVGGPGVRWVENGVETLVSFCRDRSLPLHFVSWQVEASGVEDLGRSVIEVEDILDRYTLLDRPRLFITGWRAPSGSSKFGRTALGLSSLVSALGLDVEAVCLKVTGNGEAVDALRALDRLGRVRLPMTVLPPDCGVEGIASRDGDEVIALFWCLKGEDAVPRIVSFSGLPWGRQIRVQHFQIGPGSEGTEPIEEEMLPMQDPLDLEILVEPWWVTLVKLKPVGG